MSLSDYTSLLKDFNGRDNDNASRQHDHVSIIHTLVFGGFANERIEKIILSSIRQFLELGKHVAVSIRIVSLATSVAVICWGTSQLIQALTQTTTPTIVSRDGTDSENKESNRVKL